MAFVLLLPAILSLLLFGAHLVRNLGLIWGLMSLVVITVLFIPRAWVARSMRLVLIIAALEWGRTALVFVMEREEAGQPWLRMAVILGAVALFTAASSLVFFSKTLRRRYQLDGRVVRTQDGDQEPV